MSKAGQIERDGRGSLAFVLENFPALREMMPPSERLFPFAHGFGHGDGCSTHPELLDVSWLHVYGGREFHQACLTMPDAFFAAATRNAGGSEYVIVMWKAGQRVFHFQYQYVNFHVGNFYDAARSCLDVCLRSWWRGDRRVIWSCGMDLIPYVRIKV